MSRTMLVVLFCCFLCWTWGCTPNIPKAEYPLEMEKEYSASSEKAWNAVKEVINQSQGNIVAEDKSSGFVSFSLMDPKEKKILMNNVYVRASGPRAIKVYFISYYEGRRHSSEMEREFYQKMDKLI
jgi:hypothetical protein